MNSSLRKYLDYIPLACLLVSAIILLWDVNQANVVLVWKHYVGLFLLLIVIVLVFIKHVFGMLSLGLTVLLGVIGLLSYSPAISVTTFYHSGFGVNIPLLRFQPVFLIWATIHFVLSGRYYVGVLSKKYWQNL